MEDPVRAVCHPPLTSVLSHGDGGGIFALHPETTPFTDKEACAPHPTERFGGNHGMRGTSGSLPCVQTTERHSATTNSQTNT